MRPPNRDVFINCPFDSEYEPLFHAICFTALCCGFNPRCALETTGSNESRLQKIHRLIGECDFGVHDISRTELGAEGLPRFNMPFELGLFLGCRQFGGRLHRRKQILVLDRDRHRYQGFLSDLAGYDPESHGGGVEEGIRSVRNWFRNSLGEALPAAATISRGFSALREDLPAICEGLGAEAGTLPFRDLVTASREWIGLKMATAPA